MSEPKKRGRPRKVQQVEISLVDIEPIAKIEPDLKLTPKSKGGRPSKASYITEDEREQILAFMVVHMNPYTQLPNWSQCSKELDRDTNTLKRIWKDKDSMALDIREARQEWIPEIVEACKRVALKAVVQAENKLDTAGAGEAAKVAGILIDKQALLSGMPTSIVNSNIANMSDEERRARIDELEAKRAARLGRISNA